MKPLNKNKMTSDFIIEEKEKSELHFVAQKEFLDFNEAVRFLKISKSKLYKLTSKREICFSKPSGGKIFFHRDDLRNWLLRGKKKSIGILENEALNTMKGGRY